MQMPDPNIPTIGTEHWTERDGARLFMWNKRAPSVGTGSGVILFVLAGRDLLASGGEAGKLPDDFGIVPLGMPLIAGPALITTLLLRRTCTEYG